MNKILTLDELQPSQIAKIIKINSDYELKKRLYDLGILPNSNIRCEFKSPFNDPVAYFVKGSTIALRCEDAKNISVQLIE